MQIDWIVVGKTDAAEIESLTSDYMRRINRYCRAAFISIPDLRSTRSLSAQQQRTAEGAAILRLVEPGDYLALLDERGEQYRSPEFAQWLQKRLASGARRLIFVVGGPYGFSEQVYARADAKISLSKMTFPHQLVRAIFAEQLYRAFTILRNEPYHHE